MHTERSTTRTKAAYLAAWIVLGSLLPGCAVISQTEYEDFKPMPYNARLMRQVKLSWEVREDASEYCESVQATNGKLKTNRPIACAVWSTARSECKIVTSPNPNHLVLGHEVRHCFEGHFH